MGIIKDRRLQGYVNKYLDKRYQISEFIVTVLEIKGLNKSDLANEMGKEPSEITKLVSVDHNMTLKSIAKLEDALDVDIISINNPYVELSKKQKIGKKKGLISGDYYKANVKNIQLTAKPSRDSWINKKVSSAKDEDYVFVKKTIEDAVIEDDKNLI